MTGGTATCDGIKCGIQCPAGKKPCLEACIDEAAACDGMCAPGKNPCAGICVDATSVSACGSACAPCPTSPNGETSCDGDKCLLKCKDGHHQCGGDCVRNDSIASCGAGCTACPVPTGGTATCDGTQCGATCPAPSTLCNGVCLPAGKACDGSCPVGTHNCSGNCVANSQTSNCGSSACVPCKPPANATATCDGNACDFTCNSGFHRCGNECKDDKSTGSCGGSCSACPGTSNGGPTCDGKTCGLRCDTGMRLCDGVCRQCCNDGQCAKVGDKAGVCNNGSCGTGSCPAGTNDCGNNVCKSCCNECCNDAMCGTGKVCQSNKCVDACTETTCTTPNPCTVGQISCPSKACVETATHGAACGTQGDKVGTCNGSTCEFKCPSNKPVESNGHCCPTGQIYSGGQCQDTCSSGDKPVCASAKNIKECKGGIWVSRACESNGNCLTDYAGETRDAYCGCPFVACTCDASQNWLQTTCSKRGIDEQEPCDDHGGCTQGAKTCADGHVPSYCK